MNQISDVEIRPMPNSLYLRPCHISFSQQCKKKSSDCISEHDDVVILIYNSSRDVLVFVKQFRPAVYLHSCEIDKSDHKEIVNTDKYPGSFGLTIELCSGIVDKQKPVKEIAQEEVLEECGYKVPLDNFKYVTSYRNGSVTSGALSTLFFVQVDDSMRVGPGGGLVEEGEMIEVVEMSRPQAKVLMMNETVNRDMALVVALQWFFSQSEVS